MRLNIIITAIILMSINSAVFSSENPKVKKLIINNSKLDSVICYIIDLEWDYSSSKKDIIFIGINKKEETSEIRIGYLDKQGLSYYIGELKDPIAGYIEKMGYTIFVIGDYKDFFCETSQLTQFDFYETVVVKGEVMESGYTLNWLTYEPTVSIYEFKNNQIKFIRLLMTPFFIED